MKINHVKLKKEAPDLGIRLVILFGSQATGQAQAESDYDVAVLMARGKEISQSFDQYSRVASLLAESLNIPLEKLDLTNLNDVNPLLQHYVFRDGQLLFGDQLLFHEEQAVAFREYHDAQRLFDLEKILIQKRQKRLNKMLD